LLAYQEERCAMTDEREDVDEKIENPWNELKRTEVAGSKSDEDAAPRPEKKLPEGSYGELNRTDEDGKDMKGE
jgi:hypothetical protein